MKPETKYKGSIKLSAIGDALGWITEFEKSTTSIKEKFGTDKIDKFYSWKKSVGGRFYGFIDNIEAGSYSDDTQLLLAVARSIKKDGSLDNNYFAKTELANWLDYARGGGRTVKTAADKISRKSTKWYNNFYNFKVNGVNYDYKQSGANGAAMRVLPIALANFGDVEKIKEEIFCNSIITHGHPRAILGAMLYGYAVNQIILYRPEDFNWDIYITQIGTDFQTKFQLPFLGRIEIREWLKEWNKSNNQSFEVLYQETLVETQNQLRYIFQSIKQNLSVKETLTKLGCFDNETKGSGIATVVAGIYLATKFNERPLEAIIEAVNAIGSDTDSIAAFAGGLIGALHGQNIIPDKWKSVQDNNYLEKISEDLLAISEGRYTGNINTSYSNHKLLNNPSKDDYAIGEIIEFIPLGIGKVTSIDRQPTLTKGKYNLLINALFENGQSILISKIFSDSNDNLKLEITNVNEVLLDLALQKLTPKAFSKFETFLAKNKKISDELREVLTEILKNEQ